MWCLTPRRWLKHTFQTNWRATAHAAEPSVCTKETCIEKGPQRSVPCPLEALVVEKCNRCCFHMTGQRFDPFRCLFAVHIYIHSTYTVHIYVYIYNSRTAAGFVSKPCETATTNNAEMLPTKRIRSWMSFQNLWRTAMKCQISKTSVPSLWRTASETAEQQQDSCPNHAKQRPRTMPKCCLRNALRAEWASKTFGGPLWNVKHQKLASKAFGGPLAKPPNSSRIRAKTMLNSDHEQCRNVAYETHKVLNELPKPLAGRYEMSNIKN